MPHTASNSFIGTKKRHPDGCSKFQVIKKGPRIRCHCEPVLTLAWQSVSLVLPWLPLWGSCHEVTERVKTPSPPLRGTSPIGRGKPLIRLALAGNARATCTLWSNCHWQLLDFDSLRGAPPRRGRLGDGLPHQCEHWFAMTASISVRCNYKEAPGDGCL